MTDKKLMAKSKAEYRGVFIYETEKGFSLFLNGKQFYPKSFGEATAMVDAAHVLSSRIVAFVNMAEEKAAVLSG